MEDIVACIIAQIIVTAFLVVIGMIASKILNLDERTTVTVLTFFGTIFSMPIIWQEED